MASRCNMSNSLNPRIVLRLLTLFLTLTLTWPSPVTGASLIQLRGEVGGNVTFQCDVDKKRKPVSLYFQRDNIFINGYHESRNITPNWNNTRMDPGKTAINMDNLKVSHAGDYQCFIRYTDNQISDNQIRLSITAHYSTPALTVDCSDEIHCQATCASHDGYPSTQVMWNVPESSLSRDVNSSEMIDPETKLVSISSTAFFNCSNGELTSLSCSVGHVTSEMFSVCKPKDPPELNNFYVIAAATIALIVVAIIVVVLVMNWRMGRRGRPTVDARQETGLEEEMRQLK